MTVPIRVFAATESRSVQLHQIHTADAGRVRHRRVCELDGLEIPLSGIGRAYESGGTLVPLSDDDLATLPIPTAQTMELVAVVPAERIRPLDIGAASYYLGTDGTTPAAKPYVLLRDALARRAGVAIVKYALRGREHLGMLRPLGDVLVVNELRWTDEIRMHEGLAPATTPEVDEGELQAALALIDSLTVDSLDQVDVHDHYREALEVLVAAKSRERSPAGLPGAPRTRVVDLMTALEQSVRNARKACGEE